MIGFTFLAFQALKWQSNDIAVSIVSESNEGSGEVTISVLNTAGSTLLFYENDSMTGKIEYLSDEGWVDYCDVSYTLNNVSAISQQYGGIFAELEPGENWDVSVPKNKISEMKNGTYRIKMTYITEKAYNEYLDEAFENRDDEEDDSVSEALEPNFLLPNGSVFNPTVGFEQKEEEPEEETFLASSQCEVFVKTFEYTNPDDFVEAISIDDNDIDISQKSRNAVVEEME